MGDLTGGLSEKELGQSDSLVFACADEIPHGLAASANS